MTLMLILIGAIIGAILTWLYLERKSFSESTSGSDSSATSSILHLEQQLAECRQNRDRLESQLKQMPTLSGPSAELEATPQGGVSPENQSDSAMVAQLQQQISECSAARQRLETEIAALKRAGEESEALAQENAQLKNERTDTTQTPAAADDEKDQLRAEIARLEIERDAAIETREQAEAKLGEPDELPILAEPTDAPPDDLTVIKGIGKILDGKLRKLGYTTFQQVADLQPEQVAKIDEVLDFKGRIVREKWVEQAKELVQSRK